MNLQKNNENMNNSINSNSNEEISTNIISSSNDISSNYKIYEEKLKTFLEAIKANKIKYKALKVLFEYEDNFKLVYDLYQKNIKTSLDYEILNFFLKSLGNFISLIHSNESVAQLDKILTTVNKYLKVKLFNKNIILYKPGDIGKKYYILLKGKAYTLVPKTQIKSMTFDEYKNHLKILYIFGEDYLLEKTMYSNAKSIDISYSDINSKDNILLRKVYQKNFSCNFDKYIKIINGDEFIEFEDFDTFESQEEYNNNKNKNGKNKRGENNNEVGNYIKAKKFLQKYFIDTKVEKQRNSVISLYSPIEIIQEQNKESKKSGLDNIKLNIKIRKELNEKKMEKINTFNIGIPKELLIKDKITKISYDGGELPTFFSGNKNINGIEEKDDKFHDDKKNLNNNKDNNIYNYSLNLKINLIIIGYTRVGIISPGMNFGEISLLKENHITNSSVFVEEDSYIGKLNINEYNITIKAIRTKIRTNSINFLLNIKLFGDISYNTFLNKYWIYFQSKQIQKGELLFRIGDESENVYIIYNGEIKLNAYIDKDNIDDLINGIKKEIRDPNNFYLKAIKNLNNNNNSSNNSIFERKQKFCLMIGKKGDILGLKDIINYQNNKYICEGEVITDHLSYYEINKNIIFGNIPNINNTNINNSNFNLENIEYITKAKKEFMFNKLKDIKTAVEQRYNYLKTEDNNLGYKNKIIQIDENQKYKLNKNKKSLTQNSYNFENKNQSNNNNNNIMNSNEKQLLSTSFFKFEEIKESINNLIQSQTLNKRKLSENNDKYLASNRMISNNILSGNTTIFGKADNSKKKLNLKLKNDIDLKNTINIRSKNLTLELNNEFKETKINLNTDLNSINNCNSNNNSNNNSINNSINKIPQKEDNKNYIKTNSNYNLCKPYEFPNIQNDNDKDKGDNWKSFKKIKILKFLFLNDNNQRYKNINYHKIKKNNIHQNPFLSTLRSNTIKTNRIDLDNIDNHQSYAQKQNVNIKDLNLEKKVLKPIKLNIRTENLYSKEKNENENNSRINSKKYSLNRTKLVGNDISLTNKYTQINFSYEKNKNNSLFINKSNKESLIKNYMNRLKNDRDLLPFIENSKKYK